MALDQPPITRLSSDEEIAQELERVAALVRQRPELNYHAADRLLHIARAIRADAADVARKTRPKAAGNR